jgi:IS5 family transposase
LHRASEFRPAFEILHGDKGYDSDAIRRQVEKGRAVPSILPKANRKRKRKNCFLPFLYRNRKAIERMFCHLRDFRRWRRATTVTPRTSAAVWIAATVSYWL